MPIDSELIDRIFALPEADRADLAHRLLLSLETATADLPTEDDHWWKQELEKRVDEFDQGLAKLSPWADAEKRIRESLRKSRRR